MSTFPPKSANPDINRLYNLNFICKIFTLLLCHFCIFLVLVNLRIFPHVYAFINIYISSKNSLLISMCFYWVVVFLQICMSVFILWVLIFYLFYVSQIFYLISPSSLKTVYCAFHCIGFYLSQVNLLWPL